MLAWGFEQVGLKLAGVGALLGVCRPSSTLASLSERATLSIQVPLKRGLRVPKPSGLGLQPQKLHYKRQLGLGNVKGKGYKQI